MIEKEIVGKVLEVFLKEYQSVWLIDINDNSIKLYWPTEGRLYEEFADMMKVIDELSDYDRCASGMPITILVNVTAKGCLNSHR